MKAGTGFACWLALSAVQASLLALFGRRSVIEVALVTSLLSVLVFLVLRAVPLLH